MSLSIYRRMPKSLPYSLGFKKYVLEFTGSNSYVSIGQPNTADEFMIEILCLLRNPGHTVGFFGNWHGWTPTSASYFVWADPYLSPPIVARFAVQGVSSASPILSVVGELDKWYHIVAIYRRSVGKLWLYINGVLKATASFSEQVAYPSVSWAIATYPNNLANSLLGYIAYVRVYNEEFFTWLDSEGLSLETVIRYNMLNYHNPIKKGLVLWLHDRIEDSTWYDESGYDNHGTIYNATKKPISMWELRTEIGL